VDDAHQHARVLRQAQAGNRRVVLLTRISETPTVAGRVEQVATSDAFTVVGGIHVPLDQVIRVTVSPRRKAGAR
jgi:hypothetical protein